MISKIEFFTESILLSVLNQKIPFNFAHSLLDLLSNPKNQSLLAIVKFYNKHYKAMEREIEEITDTLNQINQENIEYSFKSIFVQTLSCYKYNFLGINNVDVSSNLLFFLIKKLCLKELTNFIDYIKENELNKILQCIEIYNNSYVYSTVIHELIKNNYDTLALSCAQIIDDKTLLFIKDAEGNTPMDLSTENNCPLCFEYFDKINKFAKTVGIFSN